MVSMRTNVNLDDEAHQIATVYASAKGISLSAAIGELVRKGSAVRREPAAPSPRLITAPNGLRIVPKSAVRLSSDAVQAALDEED